MYKFNRLIESCCPHDFHSLSRSARLRENKMSCVIHNHCVVPRAHFEFVHNSRTLFRSARYDDRREFIFSAGYFRSGRRGRVSEEELEVTYRNVSPTNSDFNFLRKILITRYGTRGFNKFVIELTYNWLVVTGLVKRERNYESCNLTRGKDRKPIVEASLHVHSVALLRCRLPDGKWRNASNYIVLHSLWRFASIHNKKVLNNKILHLCNDYFLPVSRNVNFSEKGNNEWLLFCARKRFRNYTIRHNIDL